ncbi:antigen-presenting glycoprotein CD1d-like [Hyperolius riggenbachi]|uniref:antigen-presenting glycoprotein CD1d-like n=1 Tax=Hyperolius riggenbachi TaxID=752182 RepID=UPI0035A2664F
MYPWGTAQFGGIVVLSFHNASEGIVFTQSWSKGNLSAFSWSFFDMFLMSYFEYFHEHVIEKMHAFGVKGPLIVQALAGCSSDPGTPEPMFYKLAINFTDLMHLNVDPGIWISPPYASPLRDVLNADAVTTKSLQMFLKKSCELLVNSLLLFGRATLERRIQPEVFLTHHQRNSEDDLYDDWNLPRTHQCELVENSKVKIEGALSTMEMVHSRQ